jgi:hypothetical protein
VANLNADSTTKRNLGISGRLNRNGNDGRVSRFGWKAQNPTLLVVSGEAYNVEMGITNEAFQIERDETTSCQFADVPNDVTAAVRQIGAIENFANFQRFLAPPTPVASFPGASSVSIARGKQGFSDVGCALCHTPSLPVNGNASVVALRNQGQPANLYSDLALHAMGPGLADDILQGAARGDEFRTAPLWGLGKRIFFLHDGRTTDLEAAIQAHKSDGSTRFGPSEANAVIGNYNRLSGGDQQDLLNFLRSLYSGPGGTPSASRLASRQRQPAAGELTLEIECGRPRRDGARHRPEDLELEPVRVLGVERQAHAVARLAHERAGVDESPTRARQVGELVDLPRGVIHARHALVRLPHARLLEQAQVVIVRRARNFQERGVRIAALHLEADDVAIKRDAALDIRDPEHQVLEPLEPRTRLRDAHRISCGYSTLTVIATQAISVSELGERKPPLTARTVTSP